MSKKSTLAELRFYLQGQEQLFRALGVTVNRTTSTRPGGYEVYVHNHHSVLAGRDSVHSSGRTISRTALVKREMYEWKVQVSRSETLTRIGGMAFGRAQRAGRAVDFPEAGSLGRQDELRRATTLPLPEYQHGYEIFVIPSEVDATVKRLESTPPYSSSHVPAVLVAHWIRPALAVVAWVADAPNPYGVAEWHEPRTRSAKFVATPAAYAGTWVQQETGSPSEDVLIHGFPHAHWPLGNRVDSSDYYFARDGGGEVDRVVVMTEFPAASPSGTVS